MKESFEMTEKRTMRLTGVDRTDAASGISRRSTLAVAMAVLMAPTATIAAQTSIIRVHKDPNCGCCSGWVRHLEAAGFSVTVLEENDLPAVRKRLGVPSDLTACHTAEAGGYVIEGHVPALAVQRLLKERPEAIGVAVPGMPVGSPGMEGGTPERYPVVLFGPKGRRSFMEFEGTQFIG